MRDACLVALLAIATSAACSSSEDGNRTPQQDAAGVDGKGEEAPPQPQGDSQQ